MLQVSISINTLHTLCVVHGILHTAMLPLRKGGGRGCRQAKGPNGNKWQSRVEGGRGVASNTGRGGEDEIWGDKLWQLLCARLALGSDKCPQALEKQHALS